MAAEEKKIIVDDDWKSSARQERERLAAEEKPAGAPGLPDANFHELINMIAMQALAGMGMMAGPDGKPIPADMGIAKHFIDLLQVLDEKTSNNLADDEKTMLDQVLYELRMRYVEMSSGGGAAAVPPTGFTPAE